MLGGSEGSLVSLWGGEFEWDNFQVIHHQGRGSSTGVVIEYGKNLTSLEQDNDITFVYTDLLPYAVISDMDGNETVVTLTEQILPITDTTLVQRKTLIKDFTDSYGMDEEITEENLRAKAEKYIENNPLGVDSPELKISFEPLWKQPEYAAVLERVSLCDRVTIRHVNLGVSATAKVIKTVYDTLAEKYVSISLGSARSTLVDAVTDTQATIANTANKVDRLPSLMASAIQNATNLITGQMGGYVTSAGALTATSATITGTINATGGTIKNLTIDGKLTFGGNSSYYINANHNDSSWYIRLPGMTSDEASGTVFSGKLSAPTGKIGGWTIGSTSLYCTITNSDGTKKGTGFQAPSTGIWAIAVGYDSESSWANAPFRVNHNGAMYASNAHITGVITNADDDGWGVKLIENRIEFYQNSTKVSEMYAGSGYYRANMSTTSNGLYISSLLRVGGDLVCGKCLGISTGNGIYVSGKLALTMGQVKVQTNTAVQRYLLFYCGILVGIGSSKYSGISDYSASTY